MVRSLAHAALVALWSSCAIFSYASLESAQQTPPPNTKLNTPDRDKNKIDKKGSESETVIVTGCVDDGGEAGRYMLTNATLSGGKFGTTASRKSGTMGMTYTLMSGDLQAHVGHKVEVTGLMDPVLKKGSTDKNKSRDKDKSSDKDIAAATERAMNGTLTVKSVKMISTTCP